MTVIVGCDLVDVADIDEWQWMFEINVFGIARGTRAFAPMFKQQGSGRQAQHGAAGAGNEGHDGKAPRAGTRLYDAAHHAMAGHG